MAIVRYNYYRQVSGELPRALKSFREKYPPQKLKIGSTTWEYIDTQTEGPPLLILVGGLRVADASFLTTTALAEHYRVIVPTYPALDTMSELCEGIIGILDHLGIQRIAVLAGSFGGMVAQALVRHHPQRIDKLILSSTGMPKPEKYRGQMKLLEMTPSVLAKRMLPARMLAMMDVAPEHREFWRAYLNELFLERLSKEEVLCTYRCILDFVNQPMQPINLGEWQGQVLIIESVDDETFSNEEREKIRSLYPNAQVHTFEQGGHSPSMTNRDAYLALIHQFLQQSASQTT